GPGSPGKFARRKTNTAGPQMDQHSLAFLEAREMIERVMGRQRSKRQRGGFLEAQLSWLSHSERGVSRCVRAKARIRYRQDFVSYFELTHAFAEPGDDAGAFPTKVLCDAHCAGWRRRKNAEPQHHIPEVQADCEDLDFYLARRGLAALGSARLQLVQHSRSGDLELEGLAFRERLHHRALINRHQPSCQPRDIAALSPQRDLILRTVRQHFSQCNRQLHSSISSIAEVEQRTPQAGVFVCGDSSQPPHWSLRYGYVLVADDRLTLASHQPESRRLLLTH